MQTGWFGIPFIAWAAVCFVIALVWVFVWPAERAIGTTGLRFWLIRWGHTAVWVLLGVMCLLRSSGNPTLIGVAGPVGLASLLCYLGFIAASYVMK